MTLSTAPLEDGHEVRTVAELDEVLRAQHVELRALLCKLPLLHHGAREDVFLLVRRRLAVHLALETAVLLPRLDDVPEHFGIDREMAAAECEGLESIDFDAAQARVAVAFLRHVGWEESATVDGALSPREQAVVAEALELWDGRGETYLGGTWAEMGAAISARLGEVD